MSSPPTTTGSPEGFRLIAADDLDAAAATVDGATLLCGIDRALAIELELEILQTGLCLCSDIPGARESVSAYAVELGEHVTTVFRLVLVGVAGRWSIRTETYCKTPKEWARLGAVLVDLRTGRALAAAMLRIVPEAGSEVAVQ